MNQAPTLERNKKQMGTIHRAPTLGKIKKDIDSHFHGNDRKENGKDRMFFNLNLFLFLRFLVFFC